MEAVLIWAVAGLVLLAVITLVDSGRINDLSRRVDDLEASRSPTDIYNAALARARAEYDAAMERRPTS